MAIGLIRLITTQKVLKIWSVKGMKQHNLGSNHLATAPKTCYIISVATKDSLLSPRQRH